MGKPSPVAAALASLAALVLIGGIGAPAFPAEAIAGAAPQIGLLSIAAAIILAATRRRRAGLVALVIGVASISVAMRHPIPDAAPLSGDADATLVWANVFKRESAAARAFAYAEAIGADVVALAEYQGPAQQPGFPHARGAQGHDGSTITVFSRKPILDWRYGRGPGRDPAAFDIDLEDGRLTIACAHPAVPLTPGKTRDREGQIARAFALPGNAPHAIVIGDFNATPWNRALARAATGAGAARAPMRAPTWLSPLPLVGLPIDHAFAIGGVALTAERGPSIGSDHFPLAIRVALVSDQP
jgi:endonuclease/exonuclease/phosphatase (EEP) superfamily protein YafD